VNASPKVSGLFAIVGVVVLTLILVVTARTIEVSDTAAVPANVAVPPEANPAKTSKTGPFYQNPDPLVGVAGTFLKSEPIDGAPDFANVSRIMYVSEDVRGNRIPVTGMLAVPSGDPPQGGFPMIAYGHGTLGSTPKCGLSSEPFRNETTGNYVWEAQLKQLVQEGWAVVATDYEDMGTTGTPMYLIGKTQAQNVLDSVRAVHQSSQIIDTTQTVVYGHSQGGLTAYATGQLAPKYAPELEIDGLVGLAPGILPAIPFALNAIIKDPEPTGKTSFMMQIVRSWSAQFPDEVKVDEVTTDLGRTEGFDAVATECGLTIKKSLQEPMGAYIKEPLPVGLFPLVESNTVPPPDLTMPNLLVQGMQDEAILPVANIAYFNYLCNAGVAAEAAVWQNENHNGVVTASRDVVNQWIHNRFDGEPAGNDCANR